MVRIKDHILVERERLALLPQFLAKLLRLVHGEGEPVGAAEHKVVPLDGQLVEHVLVLAGLLAPVQPLRRHVGRRDDPDVGVDQVQDQHPPVAFSGAVDQLHRTHTVLYRVWVRDQPAILAREFANHLHGGPAALDPKDLLQPHPVARLVFDIADGVRVGSLTKRGSGFRYIIAVEVVQGGSAYMLVLMIG